MKLKFPADCSRCVGVSNDEGQLVAPCNTCKRTLLAKPLPPFPIWVHPARDAQGKCFLHWDMEDGAT